jgi:hypothetical protein
MSDDSLLRSSLVSVEVNDAFTEAVIGMRDGSKLLFRHRVGERWVEAEGAGESQAAQALSRIARFRLNGKHLDIRFQDGSRWEACFRGAASAFPSEPEA